MCGTISITRCAWSTFMKKRILLINPWIHDFAAFNLWSRPLGLLHAAQYLSSFDAELFFIDCTDSCSVKRTGAGKYRSEIIPKPEIVMNVPRYFKRYGIEVEEFCSRLKSLVPLDAVLLTSIMSYWYPGVQETIEQVRKVTGSVPVVLGGIYPTLNPDHAVRLSGADRIFTGPADGRLKHLLLDLGIPLQQERHPLPYYKLNFHSGTSFAPLLTSTGCPFQCSYCASRLLSPAYRRRSAEDVVRELMDLAALGIRDFAFYDDALLYEADSHIKPILQKIARSCLDIRLHAPNGLHVRFIDDKLAGLMAASGFTTIRLSLETVDRGRQSSTGGKVSTEDFERSVRCLQQHGFGKGKVGAYLMYGLPGQGLREIEEGVAFIKRLGISIHLAEFSPIRGTACWTELVAGGAIPDELDPLLTNNTVFSFLYSGYDPVAVDRVKRDVKEYNRSLAS